MKKNISDSRKVKETQILTFFFFLLFKVIYKKDRLAQFELEK